MIVEAHTVANPGTVVVHPQHTSIAYHTMVSPWRFQVRADFAESVVSKLLESVLLDLLFQLVLSQRPVRGIEVTGFLFLPLFLLLFFKNLV